VLFRSDELKKNGENKERKKQGKKKKI